MTAVKVTEQKKPRGMLFLSEGIRSAYEMATLPVSLPALRGVSRGDGHTVMVIPGFTANDASTKSLRSYLSSLGYDVHGWGQGTNVGARDALFASTFKRIEELANISGQKITLIGQSLGGVYARELAKLSDNVRQVICLGSPVDRRRGDGSHLSSLYEYVNRDFPVGDPVAINQQVAEAPSVPCTMVFSQEDGIVHWHTCVQQVPGESQFENVRVYGSHSGMGFNPVIYYLVADRLAQAEGQWQPFRAPAKLRRLFPNAKVISG
jgi:pimeloyl-ACP methyl ester carboxylesterase